MFPGQPSQTLLGSAIRRAQHQLLDAPVILRDSIVLKLVPEARDPAVLPELGDATQPLPVMLRSLFAVRSRFAEDRMAEAAARGLRQYLMLGAGLDTFPWRQPDFARQMQIFAVDHPASLVWTHQRLRERGFAKPPNLIHVPANLEDGRLAEQLAACGFDPKVPSFCSALGLLQYLEADIADDLLRFVVTLGTSSEVVFSFNPPDEELSGLDLEAVTRTATRAAYLGEPWKTRVRAQDIVGKLSRLGFREVFHRTPELAQSHYFAGRSDKLRAPLFEQLISAIV